MKQGGVDCRRRPQHGGDKMLNLYECHFQYNDVYSRDYGLIIANIETSRFTPIVGQKKGAFLFNRKQKASELMGDNYEDTPLSIEIEIVTCNSNPLDLRTLREVERWLFQNSKFRPLFIDIEDDPYGETYELINGEFRRLYLNCRFMNPEKIESHGGVIGFKCTLETDSMMMWQEEMSSVFSFQESIIAERQDGTKYSLWPLDVDMDGQISVSDAQTILQVYTNFVVAGRDKAWILENIIRPLLTNPSEQDVENAYRMCDYSYTKDDYENDRDPNITTDSAQKALQIYVNNMIGAEVTVPSELSVYDPIEAKYSDGGFDIYIDTDIDGYVYPKMVLISGERGGTIEIENTNDKYVDSDGVIQDRIFKISNIPGYYSQAIVIDSKINYVEPTEIYQNIVLPNFIRLTSGWNHIRVNGDVRYLTLTWQNRRFL